MPATPKFKSLREAMIHVLAEAAPGKIKASDLIEQTLILHPLAGKTPKATASTCLLTLTRKGYATRKPGAMYVATKKAREFVAA
jgi:DNA-binding IclR family transcriptional regulator